jgi:putative sigma-54 modulation protein
MNVKITFKKLEHTPALDQRIKEKSEKLKCYFEGKTNLHWVCWVGEDGWHHAELKVCGPKFEFFAKAHDENLYKCFDLIIAKMEKQLEKRKDKLRNHVHVRDSIDQILKVS